MLRRSRGTIDENKDLLRLSLLLPFVVWGVCVLGFILLTGFNFRFGILNLIWGYICVGIGYGLHKLLQRLGFIRDEGNAEPVSLIQVQS